MKLTFVSKSGKNDTDRVVTTERLVNLYPVPAPEGALAPLVLRAVPGTLDFTTLPLFFRAAANVSGTLYAIAGGGLYRITEAGIVSLIGAVPDDPYTSMVGHRSNVTISAGDAYLLYDGTSITQPGSGRIAEVGSVAFLDQFTLLGERDGRELEWTEAGLPADRNALYFKTAEARDDKIVRILESGAYVWVFKERSTEIFGNTTLGGASAFRRVQGAVTDIGLKGFNLVTKTPLGMFGIGHDDVAYILAGDSFAPVSTPEVQQSIKTSAPTHCFYYEDRGVPFHVIRFADRPAWVLSGGDWHERSSGIEHGPWDVVGAVHCYGQWHLFSRVGRVYRLGPTPVDATGPMRRTATSIPFYMEGKRFTVALLELLGQYGAKKLEETAPNWIIDEMGIVVRDQDDDYLTASSQQAVTTVERPGRVWIRVNRDGIWGLPKIKDIAKVGENKTCRFRAMGRFRRMAVEVNMTDSEDFPLYSDANIELIDIG